MSRKPVSSNNNKTNKMNMLSNKSWYIPNDNIIIELTSQSRSISPNTAWWSSVPDGVSVR